jgi:hypothetical protein
LIDKGFSLLLWAAFDTVFRQRIDSRAATLDDKGFSLPLRAVFDAVFRQRIDSSVATLKDNGSTALLDFGAPSAGELVDVETVQLPGLFEFKELSAVWLLAGTRHTSSNGPYTLIAPAEARLSAGAAKPGIYTAREIDAIARAAKGITRQTEIIRDFNCKRLWHIGSSSNISL